MTPPGPDRYDALAKRIIRDCLFNEEVLAVVRDDVAVAIRQAVAERTEQCASLCEQFFVNEAWLGDPKVGLGCNARHCAEEIRKLNMRES